MRRFFTPINFIYLGLSCLVVNGYFWFDKIPALWWGAVLLFLAINVLAGTAYPRSASRRLRVCRHGGILLCLFAISLAVSILYHLIWAIVSFPQNPWIFVASVIVCVAAELILFWNGILCVYFTSVQLGIRWRVIGVLCGMIPVVNLVVLDRMIKTVMDEVAFEWEKEQVDAGRREERVCETRYPLLLVHGVFFRDSKHFNYWGRIPRALEINGAQVYYGEHASARSVAASAEELAIRIRQIAEENGGKVNIIAHSKGGLDCRYALAKLGVAPYVASLTTINTPHRGCRFADYLLEKIPSTLKQSVADTYNSTLEKLGDREPDFLAAVSDLTAAACEVHDRELTVPKDVFCQSVGSRLNRASSGKFPLNFSYHLAHHFDGPGDGLVGEGSFRFGETYRLVTVRGPRGVSHGDMIDLNRENIPDFDVREFYVELVHDLKKRGF